MSLSFAASSLLPSYRPHPSKRLAESRKISQPSHEITAAATPTPSTPSSVRKRARFTAAQGSPPAGTTPAPKSTQGIDSAIRAGALTLLPSLVTRDLRTLSYGSVARAVSALVKASHWRAVLSVHETAASLPSLRCRFTVRIYTDYFFSLMKLGSRQDAIRAYEVWHGLVANDLDDLVGPRAFNFIYVLLSRTCMLEEALEVQQNCVDNGFYLNRYSYNAFLNACAKSHRVTEAFDTLRYMAESNVSPDVVSFNVLISCCIRAGDLDIAMKVLDRMKDWGVQPDIYSYNSMVNGLRKNRKLEEAFALVELMEEEAGLRANGQDLEDKQLDYNDDEGGAGHGMPPTTHGVSPDLVTYNTLISGIASMESPDFNRALGVKKHMEERGIRCNEVSYNALMAAAARSDHIDEAFEIYDEMLSRSLKPNCECFTTLITLCGRARLIDRAFKIHEQMVAAGIERSVVTYNALLTACRCAVDRDAGRAALDVLKDMEGRPGCTPDVITYSTVIDALGRSRRFHEARLVMKEMMKRGVEPNLVTYTSVIAALTRAGDLPAALEVLEDMESRGVEPNVYTFSSLINGAGRCGEFKKAFEIFDKMRDRGIRPSQVTYTMLVQLSIRAGSREYLDTVVTALGRDARLHGTPRFERVEALSNDKDVFDQDRNWEIVYELNDAVRKCFELTG